MVVTEGLELAPAVEAYLAYCRNARRLSDLTCSAYRTDLRAFQAIAGGGIVDRQAITAALARIIENPEHKPGTIARRVVAVHGFLNWQDEVLAYQVFSRLKFKMIQPKRLPKTIPERELNLLFAASRKVTLGLAGIEMHLILLHLAATGLRISELCSLRLLDVDIERGELSVFGKAQGSAWSSLLMKPSGPPWRATSRSTGTGHCRPRRYSATARAGP